MKTIKKLIEKNLSEFAKDMSFSDDFNQIIIDKCESYGTNKAALKSFFEDLQHGGCISGMIGDFIYHADTKKFYIEHLEDLEAFKEDLEEQYGEPITNRHKTVHYTFVVWLCFEEYCYSLYNAIFEQ